MSAAVRAVLAFLLLAGFHVLSWTLVLGYAAFSLVVLWLVATTEAPLTSPVPLFAVAFGFPAVVALLRGLFAGGRAPQAGEGTVRVTRKQAPGLWETVTGLAGAVGAPAPTEIRLTLEANASVSEDVRGGLRVTARRMEIGVPLLAGLRADELRAVLCHELGHYARRHTRFAATVYRGSVALHTARSGFVEAAARNPMVAFYAGLQFRVLSAYAWLYDAVSFGVRRRQEFEADAAAAAVAGHAATASALRAVHSVGAAWADYRERFLEPMVARGRLPDDLLRPFALLLADPEYARALREWRPDASGRRGGRFDSHPPLERRLAALARPAGADAARDPRPGLALLGDADGSGEGSGLPVAVRDALLRPLLPPGGARRRGQPWEEWLDDTAEVQAVRAIEGLRGPLALLGGSGTLGDVLDLLADGRGPELAQALDGTGWGADQWGAPGTVRRALSLLVGQGLVTAGRAGWSVRSTGPGALVPYGSEAREAYELAREAADDPAAVARLRFLLVLCEVNTTVPLERTGQASRLGLPAPGKPRRDAVAPARRPLNVGGLVVALAIGGFFLWSQFDGDRQPGRPLPGTPVAPFPHATGGVHDPDGPYGPAPYRPGPPYGTGPTDLPRLPLTDPNPFLPTCGAEEVRIGGSCASIGSLPSPSLIVPLPQE
ncbi:M48 family metalloprotease [Streptomyces sp. TRM 70351]|uniref:M48 family metalloprotease n=1 Tax=Streptomyces sp. TRM 70351 TaxID=3116552 RepID=UPI002E7AECB4|nr:M48 family metalloprotease [Streptomyces sp. TRM 70351]MEE1928241.1 M48 family metalloprotease [Streptomyces sp. TRM 70351]